MLTMPSLGTRRGAEMALSVRSTNMVLNAEDLSSAWRAIRAQRDGSLASLRTRSAALAHGEPTTLHLRLATLSPATATLHDIARAYVRANGASLSSDAPRRRPSGPPSA